MNLLHSHSHEYSFANFIGQDGIVRELSSLVSSVNQVKTPFPDLLISGASGMGKLRLAETIANELGVDFVLERVTHELTISDFCGFLTSRKKGDVFILLGVDLLGDAYSEKLANALGRGQFTVLVEEQEIDIDVDDFTFIGITSEPSRLRDDLLLCLKYIHLSAYASKDMVSLAVQVTQNAGMKISPEGAEYLVRHTDQSPGQVKLLSHRVIAYANSFDKKEIDLNLVMEALEPVDDIRGLEEVKDLHAFIRGLSGVEFERLVRNIFEWLGFEVTYSHEDADHEIDFFVSKGEEIIGIQCKCCADGAIEEACARDFYSSIMAMEHVRSGAFVTTSNFSNSAREFAASMPIHLVDGASLLHFLSKHRPSFLLSALE